MSGFCFDNSYAALGEPFAVRQHPTPVRQPRLLVFNDALCTLLGGDVDAVRVQAADWFSGNRSVPGALPVAIAYAGHQFGNFVPQLGDGRAVLLGEVIGADGLRRDVQLKGAGRTPFSRGGDGRAALGPVLREYLVSEAMHALGVPTTRALAAVLTGEPVFREQVLPGAVVTRVASSHLRVGTFEFFAARDDVASLRRLLAYVVQRHYPALGEGAARVAPEDGVSGPAAQRTSSQESAPVLALELLCAVSARQAALVAQWMAVGFVHGVMNTDNCSIAGETIDYGPCAFMEAYDPATVFSSIDRHGRYAYANQAPIAQWNLARLAEALLPLFDADRARAIERATEVVTAFQGDFAREWQARLGAKLGFWALPERAPEEGAGSGGAGSGATVPRATGPGSAGEAWPGAHPLPSAPLAAVSDEDAQLIADWLALLQQHRIDWTNGHRALCSAAAGDEASLRDQFVDRDAPSAWLARWRTRLGLVGASPSCGTAVRPPEGGDQAIAAAMRRINPAYIPRNHAVEAMIAAATEGDMALFERLQRVLATPFDEQPGMGDLTRPAPHDAGRYVTFCGT